MSRRRYQANRGVRFDLPERSESPSPTMSNIPQSSLPVQHRDLFSTQARPALKPPFLTKDPHEEVDVYYDSDIGDTKIVPAFPTMEPMPENMDDLSFLEEPTPGIGHMRIINPDGTDFTISNVNMDIIYKASPSLACSFVTLGMSRHWFMNFSQTAVIALLRACYQEDYTFCPAMISRPIPLLLHLQVLWLAIRYRMDKVIDQARVNATETLTNIDASNKPMTADLCECIKFIYGELRHSHDLRQAIAMYCLWNYQRHNEEIFRQTVYQSPAFHRDLQHANYLDNFQQPHAAEILKLPVCEHWAHANDHPPWKGVNDFTCEFHDSLTEKTTSRDVGDMPLLSYHSSSFSYGLDETPKRKVTDDESSFGLPFHLKSEQEQKRTRWFDTSASLRARENIDSAPRKWLPLGEPGRAIDRFNGRSPSSRTSQPGLSNTILGNHSTSLQSHPESNLTAMLQSSGLPPSTSGTSSFNKRQHEGMSSYYSWHDWETRDSGDMRATATTSDYDPVSSIAARDERIGSNHGFGTLPVKPKTVQTGFPRFGQLHSAPSNTASLSKGQSPSALTNQPLAQDFQSTGAPSTREDDIIDDSSVSTLRITSTTEGNVAGDVADEVADDASVSTFSDWTVVDDSSSPVSSNRAHEVDDASSSDSDWSAIDIELI